MTATSHKRVASYTDSEQTHTHTTQTPRSGWITRVKVRKCYLDAVYFTVISHNPIGPADCPFVHR